MTKKWVINKLGNKTLIPKIITGNVKETESKVLQRR